MFAVLAYELGPLVAGTPGAGIIIGPGAAQLLLLVGPACVRKALPFEPAIM